MPPAAPADDLSLLLARSAADAAFRREVQAYAEGRPVALVVVARPAPRVKVLRVITQLLHAEPALGIARVVVDAVAGCCDFRGTLVAHGEDGPRVWRFTWDCRWRAEESGLLDRWGSPDQARAAREFAWRCFSRWEPVPSEPAGRSGVEERP